MGVTFERCGHLPGSESNESTLCGCIMGHVGFRIVGSWPTLWTKSKGLLDSAVSVFIKLFLKSL